MVLTAAALAATPAANGSYPGLLLTRTVAGLVGALVFVTAGVIAARVGADARSAAPLPICFARAGLGIAVSSAVIPPLHGHHPGRWPRAWGLLAAAGLATVISWTAAQGRRVSGTAAAVRLPTGLPGVCRALLGDVLRRWPGNVGPARYNRTHDRNMCVKRHR